MTEPVARKFSLHGLGIELACQAPFLAAQVQHLLGPFATDSLPAGFAPTSGLVLPYDQEQVGRHLSTNARRRVQAEELAEVYQDGERFWLVDERWGLAEINLLRGQWRSWVLPHPTTDPIRCAEMAVLWPLAQLLRGKGLHLLPAAAVARAGWGVLLLGAFTAEHDLRTLIRAGYRVVGQHWTALREENKPDAGRHIAMLHMPGQVERAQPRQRRDPAAIGPCPWVDLAGEHLGSTVSSARCDAVLLIDPGRRAKAHLSELSPPRAVEVLRQAWPITELHPTRRTSVLPLKLAQFSRCCELQLSQRSEDLLLLLDSLRYAPPIPRYAGRPITPILPRPPIPRPTTLAAG